MAESIIIINIVVVIFPIPRTSIIWRIYVDYVYFLLVCICKYRESMIIISFDKNISGPVRIFINRFCLISYKDWEFSSASFDNILQFVLPDKTITF